MNCHKEIKEKPKKKEERKVVPFSEIGEEEFKKLKKRNMKVNKKACLIKAGKKS